MIRKLKAVGLTVIAICALGAVAASGAQASAKFKAESYPATIEGEGEGAQSFTTEEGTIKCTGAKFTGELTAESEELSLAPAYSGCTQGGIATDAISNGCTQVVSKVIALGEPDEFTSSWAIKCPAGKVYEYTQTVRPNEHCTATYPPQTGLDKVVIKDNTAAGIIEETTEVGKITYTLEGKGCVKTGIFNNGGLSGKAKLKSKTKIRVE